MLSLRAGMPGENIMLRLRFGMLTDRLCMSTGRGGLDTLTSHFTFHFQFFSAHTGP